MKRSEVQTRYARGTTYPCINVKVRRYPSGSDLTARLGTPAHLADRIVEWLYESEVRNFWELIQTDAEDCFGNRAKVHQEGRSGGWLIVAGLPDLETWAAPQLAKWAKFTRYVRGYMDFPGTDDWYTWVADHIKSNRWDEDGAEQYNFCERRDGTTYCLVDKKWAIV